MLTMQCAEIIQSVDNTMSRKRTGKINNWPPYSKIFQYIHVKCHKASKTVDKCTMDGREVKPKMSVRHCTFHRR